MIRHAYHRRDKREHAGRKYSDAKIERIEYLRYNQSMKWREIAALYPGETARTIEKQVEMHGTYAGGRPLTAPKFDRWDFSGMNLA